MATTSRLQRDPRPRASWIAYRPLILLAVGAFALDQASKIWISKFSGLDLGNYPPFGGIEVVSGVFNIVYSVNPGAAWGMFADHGWLLLIVAIFALAAIYYFRNQLELKRLPYQVAFGLIIGGIAGNALDRLLYGHVIDFLDVDLQFYRWPTFNIADSCIVTGAIWMAIYSQFIDRSPSVPKHAIKSSPNAS